MKKETNVMGTDQEIPKRKPGRPKGSVSKNSKKNSEILSSKNSPDETITVNNDESYYVESKDGERVQVDGLATISGKIKKSMVSVSRDELRFLVDNYYQTQRYRMTVANQLRAVRQGFDGEGNDEESLSMGWLLSNVSNQEKQLKNMLSYYTDHDPVCQWCKSIIGIGPVISAALVSFFNIKVVSHYNQFHSYAGLNDNNVKWLGTVAAKKVVSEIWEELGKGKNNKVDDDVIAAVCAKTGRTVPAVINGLGDKYTKTDLESFLAKPPYNIELKTLCWKIGESFVKVSNKEGSLYGRLYRERKIYETMRNKMGDYADQAAKILKEKKFDKKTDAYKAYIQGMLPAGHINNRAKRWTVKLFIAHLFACMYYNEHGKHAPNPYPLEYQGHVDYIEPEVKIEDFIKK